MLILGTGAGYNEYKHMYKKIHTCTCTYRINQRVLYPVHLLFMYDCNNQGLSLH